MQNQVCMELLYGIVLKNLEKWYNIRYTKMVIKLTAF